MKAYTITKYGKNEKVQLTEINTPVIQANEVLVEIHAASINQLDLKIKSGEFKLILPYKLPLILGHDLAGVIIKVGANASRFKVGDEVFARARDFHVGTFAEYIAVNENDLARKPKNISMEEAASLPLVALTVWQAFVEKAKLKKGQNVFIQAGSGGVGTIAIQVAKYLGATVATTTSARNSEFVKQLGADVIIDYQTQDFSTLLKDYDFVLHSQDSKDLEKSFQILKSGGKIISISGPPDAEYVHEANLSWFMKVAISLLSRKVRNLVKKTGVDYSFLFMKANPHQLSQITTLIETRTIRPVIDKVFSFDQTQEAMDYVQRGRAKGKVVIKIN
jgi:NADPH:quinone reductase-like Zn-dependent oxidoreductase